MTATEMHGRVKSVYRQRLIEAGMPELSAESIANFQTTREYSWYDELMRNLREIDASAVRDINAAAQRDRLGISREVKVDAEDAAAANLWDTQPLGIREEVSDAGDLETVWSAVESQAKLLYGEAEKLKADADNLRGVAARLRFGRES